MIAGGEALDLLFIPFGNGKNTMISQNQLMAMDDLIANYGQDISTALGSLLDYGKSKGKTYAIPFNGSKVYPVTIAAREDILKKYNLNLEDVKSYKDLAKIFEVVKKNEPEMTCIAPNNGGDMIGGYSIGDNMNKIDTLGDNLGVLIGNDNTSLVNLYETEQYKDIVYTMRDWYKKGYILKDAATTSEVGSVMYKEGKLFSYFYVDVLDTLDNAYHHAGISQQGQQTMVKALSKPMINSSTGFYSCGISSQSKHPEAAMKWLNLMYKDPEAVNTVYWGVEGKNFVKESDGTISFAPGEETNRGYDLPFNWMFGNSALQYTFKSSGNKADYMAQRVKQNETAEISKGFGFTFNAASVQSQYTAVANVVTKYKRALETGSVDPAVELPNFIKDLKAAGVNEVIAEKQKQFDEWLAEKGK
jgi:putative aldouronate transport system substrate-binding protein